MLFQVKMDAIVVGEIPGSIIAGGALTGETGATQRLDIECAMETR